MGEVIHGDFGAWAAQAKVTAGPAVEATVQALRPDLSSSLKPEEVDLALDGLVANFQILQELSPAEPQGSFAEREAVRLRDRQAIFADIFTLTYPKVYRVINSFAIFDIDTTKELVQETYLRAWKALDGFRGDSKVSTWLCQIAINRSVTHKTKIEWHKRLHRPASWISRIAEERNRPAAKASSELDELDEASLLATFSDDLGIPRATTGCDPGVVDEFSKVEARVDLTVPLNEALGKLPLKPRQVVTLRVIYELSHAEIAEILNITETTSKVRYHRALKALRRILAPQLSRLTDDTE